MTIAPVAAAPPPAAAAAPRASFSAALDARAAPRPSPAGGRAAPPHPAAVALGAIERAQARLDQVLSSARAGRTFTAAQLLGLQAEAYRCTQTLDLGAKLVEQGAQAVKQALNTQL